MIDIDRIHTELSRYRYTIFNPYNVLTGGSYGLIQHHSKQDWVIKLRWYQPASLENEYSDITPKAMYKLIKIGWLSV